MDNICVKVSYLKNYTGIKIILNWEINFRKIYSNWKKIEKFLTTRISTLLTRKRHLSSSGIDNAITYMTLLRRDKLKKVHRKISQIMSRRVDKYFEKTLTCNFTLTLSLGDFQTRRKFVCEFAFSFSLTRLFLSKRDSTISVPLR